MAAETYAKTSYQIGTSAIVKTGSCVLWAVLVITDGTNAATVTIYDNTAASGDVLAKFVVAGATQYGGRNWVCPVGAKNGLYAAISGTGATCIVEYDD